MIPVLLCIAPAILFMVAGIFLAGLEDDIGSAGVKAIYWCIIAVVAAAVAAAGLYILYEKGVPLYDRIGENRAAAKPTERRTSFFGGKKDNFLR